MIATRSKFQFALWHALVGILTSVDTQCGILSLTQSKYDYVDWWIRKYLRIQQRRVLLDNRILFRSGAWLSLTVSHAEVPEKNNADTVLPVACR